MLQASSHKLRLEPSEEDSMPLVNVETGMGRGQPNSSLFRTASCVEDPQSSALSALKTGNLRLLSDLLAEERTVVDKEKEYPEEAHSTLLNIALEMNNIEAIKILIKGGAKPDHLNSVRKVTVLHLAATRGDPEALKLFILASGNKKSLDIRDTFGRTALHRACSGLVKKTSASYRQCVELLLQAGCSIDLQDNKGGQTPLYISANAGHFEVVKLLIDAGANHNISCQGVLITDLIREKFSKSQVEGLNLSWMDHNKLGMAKVSDLFDMLDLAEQKGEDMIKWTAAVRRTEPSDLDKDNGTRTLAQLCSERGLAGYLSVLLDQGADPNLVTKHESRSPLLLAAAAGNSLVMSCLLSHNNMKKSNNKVHTKAIDVETRQTILHQVLRKPKYDINLGTRRDVTDYPACIDLLLSSDLLSVMSSMINKQDLLGNTALHYAVQFWDQETVTRLLILGANIGIKNNLDESPISNILPDTMENFLDNNCLTSEGNPTNENFRITYKYDFLAPELDDVDPVMAGLKIAEEEDEGEAGTRQKPAQPETDVLWYMARSKDHKYLLKHPVITSFLALKWGQISSKYNANIIFFLAFVISLTIYIFSNYAGHSLGVTVPQCPSNNESMLVKTDAHLNTSDTEVIWWVVSTFLLLLILREFLQFSINPSRYFSSIENIIEVILIVITCVILFYGSPGCHLQLKRDLSAAALLFSWIEMVTIIGRHPVLSTYNTYVTMFYRVLKTFLLFLTWYSMFIIAFGLGFYILLNKDIAGAPEQDYPYFDRLELTLVKTFTMFVGELEFSDLPLDTHFRRVFFLAFLFLIVVVLMNLLNGLAVSDTGLIREQAEIYGHVCRVEAIAAMEATLLGDPSLLWKGPRWLVCLIPSCGLRRRLTKALGIRSLFRRITGSSGVLLFYSALPEKKFVIYPNRRNMICYPACADKDVGREVVDSSKQLILKLSAKKQEKQDLENKLMMLARQQTKMEENQTRLDQKLDNIIKNLENITSAVIN